MNDYPLPSNLPELPGAAGLAEWLARRNLLVTGNERLAAAKRDDLLRGIPVILDGGAGIPDVTTITLDRPQHFTGDVQVETLDSFLDYLHRYGSCANSSIYVGRCGDAPTTKNPELLNAVGVIDDHHRDQAGWKAWRCTLVVRLDPWAVDILSRIAREFSMDDLAAWIESNEAVFLDPPATAMLELATSFRANSSARFDKGRNLSNGNIRFEYVEETTATAGKTGEMAIPQLVTLRFPILIDGPAVTVICRFRYRMEERRPLFTLFLPNLREILRASADELLSDLRARADGIPVYRARLVD
jgi:hypothetical protein